MTPNIAAFGEPDEKPEMEFDGPPIEFAVQPDITDENDTPQFSVWLRMDDGIHAPIYQYTVTQCQSWYSLKRDYGTGDYEDATDAFWWCLKAQLKHWKDAESFVESLWEDLPAYERVFFHALIQAFLECNLVPEASVVLHYATDEFAGGESA